MIKRMTDAEIDKAAMKLVSTLPPIVGNAARELLKAGWTERDFSELMEAIGNSAVRFYVREFLLVSDSEIETLN